MKQLTIYCSRDLESTVVTALDHARVEGYLRVGGATGNRFAEHGRVPRSIAWEATVFMVPETDDARVRAVVEQLEGYAGSCEIAPCLRMVVSPVAEIH